MRLQRGFSQRMLANRMGVPRTYVSKIENGIAMPILRSLERFAAAFHVSVMVILAPDSAEPSQALLQDPWLGAIARSVRELTPAQRRDLLGKIKVWAAGKQGKRDREERAA